MAVVLLGEGEGVQVTVVIVLGAIAGLGVVHEGRGVGPGAGAGVGSGVVLVAALEPELAVQGGGVKMAIASPRSQRRFQAGSGPQILGKKFASLTLFFSYRSRQSVYKMRLITLWQMAGFSCLLGPSRSFWLMFSNVFVSTKKKKNTVYFSVCSERLYCIMVGSLTRNIPSQSPGPTRYYQHDIMPFS